MCEKKKIETCWHMKLPPVARSIYYTVQTTDEMTVATVNSLVIPPPQYRVQLKIKIVDRFVEKHYSAIHELAA